MMEKDKSRREFSSVILISVIGTLIIIGGIIYFNKLGIFWPRLIPVTFGPTTIPSESSITAFSTAASFVEETVKPKTQFDLTTWKTFKDEQVKIKFNYPQEWGSPQTYYKELSCSPDILLNDCRFFKGTEYSVYFPNNLNNPSFNFVVGGKSSIYAAPGRGGVLADFNGFGKENFWWDDADELCSEKNLLFCKVSNDVVHLLSSVANCGAPEQILHPYLRVMFIDRPEKTISGLVFGGSFIPSKYGIYNLICNGDTINQGNKEAIDKAILQRQLDSESMKNYDTFEKIFETVKQL